MKNVEFIYTLVKQITLAIIYFLVAQTALNFATIAGNMTLIWPSSGIALAALILFGRRYAIGIYLGAFAASVSVENPHYVSAIIALGNTLEPLLAVLMLRFLPFSSNLYHIYDYRSLVIVGCAGALVSALFGTFAIYLADYISVQDLSQMIFNWWMSDSIGVLLITPFLLLFSYTRMIDTLNRRVIEIVCLVSTSLMLSFFVLTDWNADFFSAFRGSYILIIPLFWAIMRFGQSIPALIVVVYFIIGVQGLTIQQGIFINDNLQPNLAMFWAYFCVLALVSMITAYISNERNILYQAINHSPEEIYIFGKDDLSFEFINNTALDNLNLSVLEALKLRPYDLQPFVSRTEFCDKLKPLVDNKTSLINFESISRHHDNSNYPVEVHIQRVGQRNDRYFMASVIDISERKEKEAHRTLGNQVCDLSPQAIMITGKDNQIIRINEAFTAITGYQPDDILGKNPRILSSGRHEKTFFQELWNSLQNDDQWTGEIYNRRKNGELYLQHLTIKVLRNSISEVENYIAMFTDITYEHEQKKHLKYIAEHDVLTKLPNRSLLQDSFNFAIASAKRNNKGLALLFIDLNDFKPINDNFGHTTGDIVLQTLAERMQSCIRETDMASRIGGDEFVILITDLESEQVSQLLTEKLKSLIAKPMIINGHSHQITASIGIATYPDHGDDFEALIHFADMAMYKDKKRIKGIDQ